MKGPNPRRCGRRAAPTPVARGLGLLALAACAACAAPGPDPARVRAEAVEAERSGNAGLAAERWTELAHLRGPADEEAALGRARTLLSADQLDGAANVLRGHLAAGGRGLAPALLLADVERRRGDLEGERYAWSRAVQADPTRTEAWAGLGRARLAAGEADAALEPLTRALEQRPGDVALCEDLVRAAVAAGRPRTEYEALKRRASLASPSADQLLRLAELATREDVLALDPEASVRRGPWLERAVERAPQDVRAHLARGAFAAEVGDRERAVEAYARAAEVAPDSLPAHAGWVRALAAADGVDAALDRLERSLALVDAEGRGALADLREELLTPPADAAGPDAVGPDAAGPDAVGPDAVGPDAAGGVPGADEPGIGDPGTPAVPGDGGR